MNAHLGRETGGVTVNGHMRLYAPHTYDAASSISHWDSSATPDLLMEPNYSLNTGDFTDLTTCVLYDLGWAGNHCPDQLAGVAQTLTVTTGSTLNITLTATDTSGGTPTYSIATQPGHGTLSALSGGSLTYTPVAGFVGADQFSFQVTDAGASSAAAVVTIDVQAASGNVGGTSAGSSGGGGGGALDIGSLVVLLAALAGAVAARCGPSLLRQRVARRRC